MLNTAFLQVMRLKENKTCNWDWPKLGEALIDQCIVDFIGGPYTIREKRLVKRSEKEKITMASQLQEMDLCVTYRCNQSCSFCSESAGKALPDEMPLERQLALIREAAEFGLRSIHFSGGEPTVHPGLPKMIEMAAKSGIDSRVISNGYRLSRDKIRQYKDAGLDAIMFSVDGLEMNHNCLRGMPDAYRNVTKAVEISLEEGIKTRVNMVIWRVNENDIIPLMKECEALGVDIFSAFLGCPTGRGKSMAPMLLTSWQWRNILKNVKLTIQTSRPKMQVVFEKGDCWLLEEPVLDMNTIHGCGAGCARLATQNEYIIVRSDGNIYPCVFFMQAAPPLASIKGDSLKRALQKKVGQYFYEKIARPLPECVDCECVTACNSGCRGYAYGMYHDFFQKDPRCPRNGEEQGTYFPLCPIMKINLKSGSINGSTDGVVDFKV